MYVPHTCESCGFGFITMETVEQANAAITALNTTEITHKIVTVKKVNVTWEHFSALLLVLTHVGALGSTLACTDMPGRYYGLPKHRDCKFKFIPCRGGPRSEAAMQMNNPMIPGHTTAITRATTGMTTEVVMMVGGL